MREYERRLDQVIAGPSEASALASARAAPAQQRHRRPRGRARPTGPRPPSSTRLDALLPCSGSSASLAACAGPVAAATSARRALGELLLAHGDEMQRAAVSMAALYLRAGTDPRGARRTGSRWPGEPATIPTSARLLDAAAKPDRAARRLSWRSPDRFLPRIELLGGTSPDAPDRGRRARARRGPRAPPEDRRAARARGPRRARRARRTSWRSAASRRPQPCWRRRRPPRDDSARARVSAELMELYFLRLRLRLDPERDPPAFAEADVVRAALRRGAPALRAHRAQGARRRHRLRGGAQLRQHRPDRPRGAAVPARAPGGRTHRRGDDRARRTSRSSAATRGAPPRSSATAWRACAPAQGDQPDTIGSVEGRARLERLLGDAHDVAGARDERRRRLARALHRLGAPDDRAPAAQEPAALGRGDGRGRAPAVPAGPPRRRRAEVRRGDRAGRRSRPDLHRRDRLPRPARRDRRRARIYRRACRGRPRRLRVRQGLHVAVDPRPQSRRAQQDRRPGGRGVPAHPRPAPRRAAPAARRRLVPRARALRRPAGSATKALAAADTTGKRAEIYFYEAMRRLATASPTTPTRCGTR